MGNLIEILQDNKTLSASFDDSYELAKFFGLMKYLNKGQNIKLELEDAIEEFFDYKWMQDKNLAFSTKEDIDLLEQLPESVQVKIYSDFLFHRFLYKYKRFFTFPNL
jgi:hypothetical protein